MPCPYGQYEGKYINKMPLYKLSHLVHHDHTQKFFELQKKMIPDWVKWKNKLEKLLA